jgi:protein-disulfide isomerase
MVELEEKTPSDDFTPEQIDIEQPSLSVEQPVEEPEETVEAQAKSSLPNPWLLLIIGLVVGGLAGFFGRPVFMPETDANAAPLANVGASDQMNKPDPHQGVMLAVIAGARHFTGDPNAPVTLVEFGDFNCGYCGRWAHETLPLIQEKYIKTGKVRMAYVHFPILGPDSITAAEGTECAAKQEKFWEYHNKLYASQGVGFTPENLANLAGEIGLDKTAFANCLANFTDRPALEDDVRLAQVMGVRGTPAFLVNGIALAGAYPYENFEDIIENELSTRQIPAEAEPAEPGG